MQRGKNKIFLDFKYSKLRVEECWCKYLFVWPLKSNLIKSFSEVWFGSRKSHNYNPAIRDNLFCYGLDLGYFIDSCLMRINIIKRLVGVVLFFLCACVIFKWIRSKPTAFEKELNLKIDDFPKNMAVDSNRKPKHTVNKKVKNSILNSDVHPFIFLTGYWFNIRLYVFVECIRCRRRFFGPF